MPGFRLGARVLVTFGAAKSHCAFYPGAEPIREHEDELAGYDLAKGTIRFPAEKPLTGSNTCIAHHFSVADFSMKLHATSRN
jgi:uncharacterized protein YdhG (YjbR/CyaY superfamily)